MKEIYIGIDIGGTNIRVIFADEFSLLLKISTLTIKTGQSDALVNQVISMIKMGIETLDISLIDIKGIGTSSAGPFVDGDSLCSPNICGIKGKNNWGTIPYLANLRAYFGKDIDLKLANDCVSSIQAEYIFGAAQNKKNCVYITISTGIGSGIISDGHLLFGKGGNAGHFGHTIVKKDGYLCGCGQHGCIETIASGKNITRRAKEIGLKYHNTQEYDTKEVFQLYRYGDPLAIKIINETIEYIGIFFINLINILDTEMIVVGGSVFQHNFDILGDKIKNYIDNHSIKTLSANVSIVPSQLGEFIGDIAGISLVLPETCIDHWKTSKPWHEGFQKKISFPN